MHGQTGAAAAGGGNSKYTEPLAACLWVIPLDIGVPIYLVLEIGIAAFFVIQGKLEATGDSDNFPATEVEVSRFLQFVGGNRSRRGV